MDNNIFTRINFGLLIGIAASVGRRLHGLDANVRTNLDRTHSSADTHR
jgi:hypothetical protein